MADQDLDAKYAPIHIADHQIDILKQKQTKIQSVIFSSKNNSYVR